LKALQDEYGKLICYTADVRDASAIGKIAEDFSKNGHTIDILINNAAVNLEPEKPDLDHLDVEAIQETFHVNSIAPLVVIQHFLAYTRTLIVNISSEAGSIENCWRDREYAYCMSKAALNMASKILQNRLKGENIKVLAIHPQWFTSDMGGPEAPISPEQSAVDVIRTILKDWKLEDPIYVDSVTAEKMAW
jgi:NAD(P)-dependent dehydrogenase (short-subunit alcohol dehydrogenase family)